MYVATRLLQSSQHFVRDSRSSVFSSPHVEDEMFAGPEPPQLQSLRRGSEAAQSITMLLACAFAFSWGV